MIPKKISPSHSVRTPHEFYGIKNEKAREKKKVPLPFPCIMTICLNLRYSPDREPLVAFFAFR